MKKQIILVLLAAFSVVPFCARAQKVSFRDIFQAQFTGGVSVPFAGNNATRVGTSTSLSTTFYNVVNDDFDILLSFKTNDHLSIGAGYEAAGQITKSMVNVRPADPKIQGIDMNSWDMDQEYPSNYGTYNFVYAQLTYSIFAWNRKADWRPMIYFRIGGSQNSDRVKSQAVVGSGVSNAIVPVDTWSVQTAFGFMLHKRVWKDLSVVLDIRENSFLISSANDVKGYYIRRSGDSEILYHSGKMKGWLSAGLGLSWNF